MNATAIRHELTFTAPAMEHAKAQEAIPQLISAQAAAAPNALAVQCGAETLTYAQLDQRSNRLARYLQLNGVMAEVPVGLYVERTPDFVVAALAIMKAGGAYLPVDPAWPAERIASILRDAKAPVLLSHRWKPASLPPGMWSTVDLDMSASQIDATSCDPLPNSIGAGQLAYVIYTSGSTGQPKGVEITHANLLSLIEWHIAEFGVRPSDRASQVAGLGFDAAVWEIWPNLAAGASLHFAGEEIRRSPEALRGWLIEQGITIAFVPTALAEELIAAQWKPCNLRWLLTGGDALRRYPAPNLPFKLVNNYGPTECTVLATSGRIRSAVDTAKAPSIGRAIPSAQVHILDEALRPVSAGIPGELCIGGPGVGRGYRGHPELTAAKFIQNPFGAGRLYRTGDRAQMLSDGEIQFLGRIDDQIKVRGYRIEPGEVIFALNRHPRIRATVVIARPMAEQQEDSLVAYLIPEPSATDNSPLTSTTLREFLAATLPEYMIPSAFVVIKEIPLTSSGKCDKAALPQPETANMLPAHAASFSGASGAATSGVTASGGDIADRLLKIVSSLVGSDNISPDDNFFLIGGHSMLAAQLLVRIRQEFGAALTLRQLFQAPTVSALSKEVGKLAANKAAAAGK